MIRINWRFLALLILVGGTGAGVLAGLWLWQAPTRAEALRWQARAALERNQPDRAVYYAQLYLAASPDDHDAAVELAGLLRKGRSDANTLAAVAPILEKVIREAPHREEVRRELLEIALKRNRPADALIHLAPLAERHPTEGMLWVRQGDCFTAQNKPEEARKAYEHARAVEPTLPEAHERLAEWLHRQGRPATEVEAVLAELEKNCPDKHQAWLTVARWHRSRQKPDKALAALERHLALAPEAPEGWLMKGDLLQAQGEIDAARRHLEEGAKKYAADARFARQLSWLESSTGNYPAAVAALEDGLKRSPDSPDLLTPYADLLMQTGDRDKVAAVLAKLKGLKAAPWVGRYMEARAAMGAGRWADGLALLEKLKPDAVAMPGLLPQTHLLAAACCERLGRPDEQESELKKLLALDPAHLAGRIQLANLYYQAGRWPEALKEYASATKSPSAPAAVHASSARLRFAQAARDKGTADDWKAAQAAIDKFRQQFPGSAEAAILQGELHQRRNESAEAAEVLRAQLKKGVGETRVWVALADVYHQWKGHRAALDLIDEARTVVGDSADLRLARAQLWLADPSRLKRAALPTLEKNLDGFAEAERVRLISGLAEAYSTFGMARDQLRLLAEMARRQPRDAGTRRALAEAAFDSGEIELGDSAGEEYLKLAAPHPALAAWLAGRKALAAYQPGDVSSLAASKAASEAAALHPDRGELHALAAKFADKAGDGPALTKHLAAARRAEPSNLQYLAADLRQRLRADDPNTADEFRRWFADARLSRPRFLALLEQATEGVEARRWIGCVNALAPLLAADPVGLVWLGEMLDRRGMAPAGLALMERAAKLAPHHPDVWIGLLRRPLTPESWAASAAACREQLEAGDYAAVVSEVADSRKAADPNWKPPTDAAYARARFTTLIHRDKVADARQWLHESAATFASADDKAWRVRNAALIDAIHGTPEQARLAAASVLADAPAEMPVEDLRARISVVSLAYRYLTGEDRKRAIGTATGWLEGLTRKPEASPRDWYNLAQFYRFARRSADHRRCLEVLADKEPENLFYRAALADDLIESGEADAAAKLIPALEEAKDDARTAGIVTRYYALKGDAVRANAAADNFVRAADPASAEARLRERQAADMLDRAARLARDRKTEAASSLAEAALERYRRAARHFPEALANMAGFLAALDRPAEGLALIQSQGAKLPGELRTACEMAVLRSGRATPAEFDAVGQRLAAAGDPASRMNLAEALTLRGRADEAAAIYREFLKSEPDSVVAKNNLAWVMAADSATASEGLKLVEEAIGRAGATAELLDTRARARLSAGKVEEAQADLEEALNQSPTGLRFFHLALVRLKQDRPDDAVKAFREAQARGLSPQEVHPGDAGTFRELKSKAE